MSLKSVHCGALAGALLFVAAPLAAQGSITPETIHHRLGVIADDSMMGRDTPSPGLEMTAQFVADQFASFGLEPGGEDGTWFQRYPIYRKQLDREHSRVTFSAGGVTSDLSLAKDAARWFGPVPGGEVQGPAIVLGGALDAARVGELDLTGKVALVVIDMGNLRDQGLRQGLFAIYNARPRAVVAISNRPQEEFASRVERQRRPRTVLEEAGSGEGTAAVEVREGAAAAVLEAAGIDAAAIRASTAMVTREVPDLNVSVELRDSVLSRDSAPNTIGILRGSDPRLRNQYLVYSAHMDHLGIKPGKPDSIANGADDDGSGTVAVMMLAEAFARSPERPKRSLLFITVSGEEKGLWGSAHFTDHPTVPLEDIVADINIDMIGRNWADTIVAIGKEHSDLGATLNRVNAEHAELGMTAIDDLWPEERFYSRSDHFNFARKGVPILFFFNGVHEDYHQVSDELDKIDTEKMSRIIKLLYYLGRDVADAPERPQWNPESYDKIVEGN